MVWLPWGIDPVLGTQKIRSALDEAQRKLEWSVFKRSESKRTHIEGTVFAKQMTTDSRGESLNATMMKDDTQTSHVLKSFCK